MNNSELCPRTFALWKPGMQIEGVKHHYAYSGKMPCTGLIKCTMCGKIKEDQHGH